MAFAADTFSGIGTGDLGGRTASDGGTWTAQDGAGIKGTGASGITCSASGRDCYTHSGTPPSADYEISLDVIVVGIGHTSLGPAGRIVAGAGGDHYWVNFVDSGTGWVLKKRVGGVENSIGTPYIGDNPTTTTTVLLGFSGTTIYVKINGTQQISTTDSGISGAGKAGVKEYFASVNAGDTATNFSASAAAATGGPFPMFTPGLTGAMRELGGGMQG